MMQHQAVVHIDAGVVHHLGADLEQQHVAMLQRHVGPELGEAREAAGEDVLGDHVLALVPPVGIARRHGKLDAALPAIPVAHQGVAIGGAVAERAALVGRDVELVASLASDARLGRVHAAESPASYAAWQQQPWPEPQAAQLRARLDERRMALRRAATGLQPALRPALRAALAWCAQAEQLARRCVAALPLQYDAGRLDALAATSDGTPRLLSVNWPYWREGERVKAWGLLALLVILLLGLLKRTLTITLDADWLYRRLVPGLWAWIVRPILLAFEPIHAGVVDGIPRWAAKKWGHEAAVGYRPLGVGTTVAVLTVILLAFMAIHYFD